MCLQLIVEQLQHERRFIDALGLYDTFDVPSGPGRKGVFYVNRALLNRFAGRLQEEQADWERALDLADSLVGTAEKSSRSEAIGWALKMFGYSGLGKRQAALEALEAYRASIAHDAQLADGSKSNIGTVYALLGLTDEALDTLEDNFAGPGDIMPSELTNAIYDPIRDHPRFKALVAEHPWP